MSPMWLSRSICLDKEELEGFIPPINIPFRLTPTSRSPWALLRRRCSIPNGARHRKWPCNGTRETILRVWKEFGKRFGRSYKPIETYRTEDADTILVGIGCYTETASVAIDTMRARGEKVGMVHLRLWRPFPFPEIRAALQGAQKVLVFDRCICLGGPGGPLCSEIKSALYNEEKKPKIFNFIGGLGGRDMTPRAV